MKIVSVVGTRPQLIKAAALLPELRARHDEVFIDTGQHWDERLAVAFFVSWGSRVPTTRSRSPPGRTLNRPAA